MLITISPAKSLDFDSPNRTTTHTIPDFLKDSRELIKSLRKFSAGKLSKLMSISEKLGELNHTRNQQWKTPFTLDNAKQAILAFQGDVYVGLEAETFKAADFRFAQKHLRILSGLYGVLRPLDLIQAYRLEMSTKLKTNKGKDLYEFWGDTITDAVNRAIAQQGDGVLINLASNEYFRSVVKEKLEARIITPEFKDAKGGKYKMISFFAKKARGLMSAFIIKNRLKDPGDIKGFDVAGYTFNEGMSSQDKWTFTREEDGAR